MGLEVQLIILLRRDLAPPRPSTKYADFCGAIAANSGTALATACSFKTPFRVGVHFDIGEAIAIAPNAAAGNNLSGVENAILNPSTAGEGIGTSGFWLAYWQNSC